MNIAILDYQLDYQSLVEKKIQECFNEPDMKLTVYKFSNIQDFVKSLKEQTYQFAYIEMRIENQRGIEVARTLQKHNPACRVIFMCNKYLRVPEAFQVNALEYILKPICTEKFKEVFDFALSWYKKQNIKFAIPIRTMRSRKRIFRVDDIKYIETYYNDIDIVTVDDEHYITHVKNRYKLRSVLKPRWFMQVNGSVLINMKHLDFLTDRNAILFSREVFHTSRLTLFKNHIMFEDFLREREKEGYHE